ncbi:hypothetical protein [Lewinella sp. 4G2]|uniref:hypothetical protein n=1 Tax=Lewinella sp. 4G2 TaxID=1803372 RepID=UPI0007B4DC1C|nr:hypothetical protein [Lewinella sp. 4G2]OAV43600.1 hypothetical protein A3850_003405 [Lewinella sp. 4G2]
MRHLKLLTLGLVVTIILLELYLDNISTLPVYWYYAAAFLSALLGLLYFTNIAPQVRQANTIYGAGKSGEKVIAVIFLIYAVVSISGYFLLSSVAPHHGSRIFTYWGMLFLGVGMIFHSEDAAEGEEE